MNKRKITRLSEKIVSAFGADNIVCILFHGSILFNPHILPHDADLLIVLKKRDAEDCSNLRKMVRQVRLTELPVHLHLIYLDEIPENADFFSIHTCGAFFTCHLRQAEPLYGENIFDRTVGPSEYQLQLSLLQKVQQYTFQMRNLVFALGRRTENELLWARKKSVVMLKDLLLSTGILLQKEESIILKSLETFKDFSDDEVDFLKALQRPWIKPASERLERAFMTRCLHVHEQAYGIMRKRISEKHRCRFLG
ncbi:MAG: hypothetical protein RL536_35 [Candidatus Parcubacteria bacterium]|jgi:hypothetical protein